jgi:hypothetical protein
VASLLVAASLSFHASVIAAATSTVPVSGERGESGYLNPSQRLQPSVLLISSVFEFSDLFDPSKLLGNRESRAGAESGNVKISPRILPGILAGVAILCLFVAFAMFIMKRKSCKSSTDGQEMGYETELRNALSRTTDSDSDLDMDTDGEEEDMGIDPDIESQRVGQGEDSLTKHPHDLFETEEWGVGGFEVRPDVFVDLNVDERHM